MTGRCLDCDWKTTADIEHVQDDCWEHTDTTGHLTVYNHDARRERHHTFIDHLDDGFSLDTWRAVRGRRIETIIDPEGRL